MKKGNNIILFGLAGIAALLGFQLSKKSKQVDDQGNVIDNLENQNDNLQDQRDNLQNQNDRILDNGVIPVFQNAKIADIRIGNSITNRISFDYMGEKKIFLAQNYIDQQLIDGINSLPSTAITFRRIDRGVYELTEGIQSLAWDINNSNLSINRIG